jgi:hypothetical protein
MACDSLNAIELLRVVLRMSTSHSEADATSKTTAPTGFRSYRQFHQVQGWVADPAQANLLPTAVNPLAGRCGKTLSELRVRVRLLD